VTGFLVGLTAGALLTVGVGRLTTRRRRPALRAVLDPLEVWAVFRAIRRIDRNVMDALRGDRGTGGGLRRVLDP
jgi:hypothetical protein